MTEGDLVLPTGQNLSRRLHPNAFAPNTFLGRSLHEKIKELGASTVALMCVGNSNLLFLQRLDVLYRALQACFCVCGQVLRLRERRDPVSAHAGLEYVLVLT